MVGSVRSFDIMGSTKPQRWIARPQLAGLRSVLAVCAHPDDESFGLGAIIAGLTQDGTDVSLICLTHGEASTLGGSPDLVDRRKDELEQAVRVLGLRSTQLLDYGDGRLTAVPLSDLVQEVASAIDLTQARALLVFDPEGVSGHDDHRRATAAARCAAEAAGIPVFAWVIPYQVAKQLNFQFGTKFNGRSPDVVDVVLHVDRSRQLEAIARHASQSVDNPVLRHRLDLMRDTEWLMYLDPPDHSAQDEAEDDST
jgi:LmbE family N-acetylglucosaminyl deacetylase